MNHRIIGTTLPVLELQLEPGESVVAISGELSWMSRSINLHISTQFGGGGLVAAFKRVAGGGSLLRLYLILAAPAKQLNKLVQGLSLARCCEGFPNGSLFVFK